jgi:hypothetical protein
MVIHPNEITKEMLKFEAAQAKQNGENVAFHLKLIKTMGIVGPGTREEYEALVAAFNK